MKTEAELIQIVKEAKTAPSYSKLEVVKLIKELTKWSLQEATKFVEKH